MNRVETFYPLFKSSQGISIDSRKIEAGQIFVAIKGERFDAHEFVKDVIDKGARHVVIDNPDYEVEGKTYLVHDSLEFLQALARHHRRQFKVPVMALTGSNGKTTTKELLTAVLSTRFKVYATKGNYNNHIGVPLTLLEIQDDAEFILIEMGANHIGDIAFLCRIAEPDFGLITNIGSAHIEGFGSQEGILIGKTELYRWVASVKGTIFYNTQDILLSNAIPDDVETITYSNNIRNIDQSAYTVSIQDSEGKVFDTQLYGDYNFDNMKAAYTVGLYFGVDSDAAMQSMASYDPQMNRSQIINKEDCTLIMDAYNANPSSMILAIDALQETAHIEKKVLILGDMFELGEHEIQYHKEILDTIAKGTWHTVILVGEKFEKADPDILYHHYKDVNALTASWSDVQKQMSGATILLKASRSIGLEKLEPLF
ncbi:MAG: UDP-N-acetylmuramoyl-tripeptide--D-alanyl-D-alanine ligase [Saprospiraceae bacterium]|nr:UDP-N-acetylmuramoyl-tripeptide--D-alanyl-D-alanine ligase [Saprospiraceae bacterium]